ncbi:MAG: PepSY-like domain-containing protein [Muribaculaceae bacterium]|nr:PepSY-like domain-containing protein [Muribaculaceae bacterium]
MTRNFLITLALGGLMLAASGCDDKPVLPANLPAEIQTFVKQTFPNQTITYAEKDVEWMFWDKYDVTLADGTMISFDTDNVWDKVESRMAPIPATLIPANIATYVATNFPAVPIIKVDKESYGYEVELATDLDLKFNHQGALMEMDD